MFSWCFNIMEWAGIGRNGPGIDQGYLYHMLWWCYPYVVVFGQDLAEFGREIVENPLHGQQKIVRYRTNFLMLLMTMIYIFPA